MFWPIQQARYPCSNARMRVVFHDDMWEEIPELTQDVTMDEALWMVENFAVLRSGDLVMVPEKHALYVLPAGLRRALLRAVSVSIEHLKPNVADRVWQGLMEAMIDKEVLEASKTASTGSRRALS